MSCEGCEQTVKARRREFETVLSKAITYAKEKQTAVAIYKDHEGYRFISTDIAIAEGIPFEQIVDQYYL